MSSGIKQSHLYSRHRPQASLFNTWKTDNTVFVAQVCSVRWEPHEKRHTADVVILNSRNQKWENCPICTHGAGFDRGHLWMPHPEEIVLCCFAEGMHASPIIIGSIFMDKWRLPYPPRAYHRDIHRGADATLTHSAEEAYYEDRRYGEHFRHMPRGAFWEFNRLGIYRVSDRYESDPLNREDGVQIRDNRDLHYTAGSEFLELNPKKQHVKLFGRKSVIITATSSGPQKGVGSGFIVNVDRDKEPDLEISYRIRDFKPIHQRTRSGGQRSAGSGTGLEFPEMDEGAGFNGTTCRGEEREPQEAFRDPFNRSGYAPSQGKQPRRLTGNLLEDPGTGADREHDGCLWLRGTKDVHINYYRYFRYETWVPEIVDPPCDPWVPRKVLQLGMADEDELVICPNCGKKQAPKRGVNNCKNCGKNKNCQSCNQTNCDGKCNKNKGKCGQHLAGRNKDGGHLLDCGKGTHRTRTEDRAVHYAKKSMTHKTDGNMLLSGKKVIICNPVLGCSNAQVPTIDEVDPSQKL